ncbi:MAG: hypothetical protein ABI401_08370 [Candidatus Dormibacter sp.]
MWSGWGKIDGSGTSAPAAVSQSNATADVFIRRSDLALCREMLSTP